MPFFRYNIVTLCSQDMLYHIYMPEYLGEGMRVTFIIFTVRFSDLRIVVLKSVLKDITRRSVVAKYSK